MEWRARGWWLVVVMAAVAAAVVSVVARALPAVVASAVVAAVGAVGGVWSARGVKALADGADRQLDRSAAFLVDSRGRLPRVRDIEDPVSVGVHLAAAVTTGDGAASRVPAFVRRDRSAQLEGAVRRGGFVLLVGDSTAGKSRAAFEAARACVPEHVLIRPAGREAMPAVAEAARRERRCVIWLDDLERYLGAGGLTVQLLSRLLAGDGRHVVILATMRARERARYSPRRAAGADPLASEVARSGLEVLELATQVRIDRRWTLAEQDRARALSGDERISAALGHADRFGVAEYIAAGPQLLADWEDGWAAGTHPRGAALVAAAVDARRAGYRRGLPPELLRRLHEYYLHAAGGSGLRPETWQEALAWAAEPLHATSSMLLPDNDGRYAAFDYLVDVVDSSGDADPVPPQAWQALIDAADPGEAEDIGWSAYFSQIWPCARAAFGKALDGGQVTAAAGLADCIGEVSGQFAEAARVLHAAVAAASAAAGDPADLIQLRARLSWWTGLAGDYAEALRIAAEAAADSAQTLGAGHPDTLRIRLIAARWTGQAGDTARALEISRKITADCGQFLGAEDSVTMAARFETAIWIGENGDAAGAAELFRVLESDLRRASTNDFAFLLDTRANLALWLQRAHDTAGSLELARRNAADSDRVLGSSHARTLQLRIELARATGEAGQAAEALTLAGTTLADCTQALGADHLVTLSARFEMAIWTGETGNLTDAIRQFEDLIADASQNLRADPRLVLDSRSNLAELIGKNGEPARAALLLQSLVSDRSRIQGPSHTRTLQDREHLQYWHEASTRSTST